APMAAWSGSGDTLLLADSDHAAIGAQRQGRVPRSSGDAQDNAGRCRIHQIAGINARSTRQNRGHEPEPSRSDDNEPGTTDGASKPVVFEAWLRAELVIVRLLHQPDNGSGVLDAFCPSIGRLYSTRRRSATGW